MSTKSSVLIVSKVWLMLCLKVAVYTGAYAIEVIKAIIKNIRIGGVRNCNKNGGKNAKKLLLKIILYYKQVGSLIFIHYQFSVP